MKTHCKNGHEFTEINTKISPKGWRICLICKSITDKKYRSTPKHRETNKLKAKRWRDRHPEKNRANRLKYKDMVRRIIEEAKDKPCQDCGNVYPYYVMDFHHRDRATKIDTVGELKGLPATLEEIAKCDVLCANCHRVRTWKDKLRSKR